MKQRKNRLSARGVINRLRMTNRRLKSTDIQDAADWLEYLLAVYDEAEKLLEKIEGGGH